MEKRQRQTADVLSEIRGHALDQIANMHEMIGANFLPVHLGRVVSILVTLFGDYGADPAVVCDTIEQVARQQGRRIRQRRASAERDV